MANPGGMKRRSDNLGEFSESPRRRRDLACNRVVTWNMQGSGRDADKASELRRIMNDTTVRAVCVQECGGLNGWPESQDHVPDGWALYHESWEASNPGNDRCSLAILVRGGATHTSRKECEAASGRPMLGAKVSDGHGGSVWVFNIHAPSGGGIATNEYLSSALSAANTSSTDRKYVIAGDHNLHPDAMAQKAGTNASVVSPQAPTQKSGNILDYFTVGNGLASTAADDVHEGFVAGADHRALSFALSPADAE